MKFLRNTLVILCWWLTLAPISAQSVPDLSYYLPDWTYDSSIPTPESVLGFPIGKWHLTHDQLVRYTYEVVEASDRMTLEVIGHSYEDRPQVVVTVTSPDNHQNLESIRKTHQSLSLPTAKQPKDLQSLPAVVYQGFTIHGNEPSGANAVPLLLYYLAAAPQDSIDHLLNHLVILVDICFNPDGMQRFSTWVNMHKSQNLVSDPQSREFSETWPRGRTNHYWFDLNRDWLPAQHPESQSRLALFHRWKPNVLTDHHEMGSNSTFFFQPGIPSRTNPQTPAKNQELTARIGDYHAQALDAIGSLYYTQESFDDFYYGKGSTYPDINGAVGILFEQASSRGHLQETVNGPLSFPFTIRNQLTTALSTVEGSAAIRTDLLSFQQTFFQDAWKEAQKADERAYVFTCAHDQARLDAFTKLLQRHQIETYILPETLEQEGTSFPADKSLIVPLQQPQYRLIRAMMDPVVTFQDSLFYDVSAWTLPMAFGLQYAPVSKRTFKNKWVTQPVSEAFQAVEATPLSEYAYAIDWSQYAAPGAVHQLARKGIRMKVATDPFTTKAGKTYTRGTILVPVHTQSISALSLHQKIKAVGSQFNIAIDALESGLTPGGIDLGSPMMRNLDIPKPLLVVSGGVSGYEAGEVWHLFDQRYQVPLPMIEWDDLSNADLTRYNRIILVNGYYPGKDDQSSQKLQNWVRQGGTLITTKDATRWAVDQKLLRAQVRKAPKYDSLWTQRPYALESKDRGAQYIGGSILATQADTTHPILYGVHQQEIPVFMNATYFLDPAKNPYATPLRFKAETPLLAGYLSEENQSTLPGSAAILTGRAGRGKVIAFTFNPNFRAFWYGTNHLFANAVFFPNVISRRTLGE
jgi:hypothetical protein